MEENKPKRYIVVDKTFKELNERMKKELSGWNKVTLYEKKIDLGEISERQKEIQEKSSWRSRDELTMRLYEEDLYNFVKDVVSKEIFDNGLKDKISDTIFDKVYNSHVKGCLKFYEDKKENLVVDMNMDVCIGDKYKETGVEYVHDMPEVEEKLKSIRREPFYYSRSENNKDEYVLLESISVGVYANEYNKMDEKLKKLINKVLKSDFVYCVKNDKLILPDEYLAKRESGVKEWQELKRSTNKNNSIEKRMLKDLYREKKTFARKVMFSMARQVVVPDPTTRYRWDLPQFCIDGMYNNNKMEKLVNELFNVKDKNAFINMSKEEVNNKCRAYWANQLKKSLEALENFTYEKESGNK